MARTPAVPDESVTEVLGGFAGPVRRVLTDPQRWLDERGVIRRASRRTTELVRR